MNDFSIERDQDGEWRVLRLSGRVDAHTFLALEEALTAEIESGGRYLRLDCRRLTFINSTGLGLLIATLRQVKQCGGQMRFENISPAISNILNLL